MTSDEKFLDKAIAVLRNYGLENPQLTRLGGACNVNFKVDAGNKSYVLRLHQSSRDCQAISSELVWLNSLHDETSLIVPKPLANLNGELVTVIPTNSEAETLCTLIYWIEGKIPPTVDAMSDEQLAQAGSLMAHLHTHSQQFNLPPDFKRLTYDETHFSEHLEVLYKALNTTELDKIYLNKFKEDANYIITYFAQLERPKEVFGLIHADFHSGNYLICGDKVHIIDFDLSGFGFYLYDLALALMELGEQQRILFIQGYETVKPLPTNYTNLKHVFLCLAYISNLGFLAANPEELKFIAEEVPFVVDTFSKAMEILVNTKYVLKDSDIPLSQAWERS